MLLAVRLIVTVPVPVTVTCGDIVLAPVIVAVAPFVPLTNAQVGVPFVIVPLVKLNTVLLPAPTH